MVACADDPLTLGVEEEFHVADPATRSLTTDADAVLEKLETGDGAQFQAELHESMVETCTTVCTTLGEVREQLVGLRAEADRAARAVGRRVAASGSFPLAGPRLARVTPKRRYEWILDRYGHLAAEQFVCGCHVHVGIDDRDTAVAVMTRARPWVPVLLALTASSPFWAGVDTGYASYRSQVWGQWPVAGMPQAFDGAPDYDAMVQALIDTDTAVDSGMTYWDMRLSPRFETLEFRTADVCTTVDEAVLHAGLCRGLASTCLRELAEERQAPPAPRMELLQAARWRAARFGLGERLLHVGEGRTVPAATMIERLLDHLRPALQRAGDWEEVSRLVAQVQARGTGADRQRRAFRRAGRLEDVVDLIVGETAGRPA
ncbi:MAG: glutamate--cysteine ligase [Actinobacteria bacterium]|nr:glutamate--cysteine ligase [Actinomycetota bacterium]